ncbi:MAG: hypothetical protein AB4062_21885 [Crocosphaera sp.]
MKIQSIKIDNFTIHEHHLDISYYADEFRFSTKIFYHDVSFSRLIENYSQSLINRIVAHIALFEGMKLCSLFPKYYDISNIVEYLEEPVLELFVKIYQGVFGQHWYENNVTDYLQPEIIYSGKLGIHHPVEILGSNKTILTGCGGGKDSIVAMKLLQEVEIPFASMQYSHTVYGKADLQHNLINQVLENVSLVEQHKISIFDDFIDFPFFDLYFPQNSGITAPETPVSVFESLILMLGKGYHYLSLAHEKSANIGNLFWTEIGKEVNHQWGKSLEAEKMLAEFIQNNLLSNFQYFSILQPIYDIRIFEKLSKYPEVLSSIHSCNIQKPWCKKCPKCAYVWLGFMAFLDPNIVDNIFRKNLFDDDDLIPTFRQMLGLSTHTPFECIGEINESRLMMKKCLEKGLSGKALDIFAQEILTDTSIDWQKIEEKYNSVYTQEHIIPDWLFNQIKEKL